MIEISKPIESDHRFITQTWLDSYKKEHRAGPIPYRMWSEVMRPVAVALFLMPHVITLVARAPNETNTEVDLYGWISVRHDLSDDPVVQYVYVKALYRKLGVSRKLMKAAGVDPAGRFTYSCSTKHCRQLKAKGKIPNSTFDEEAIRK